MDPADSAHFTHVGIGYKVNVAANGGKVGWDFKVVPVRRTGTSSQDNRGYKKRDKLQKIHTSNIFNGTAFFKGDKKNAPEGALL
jgi:hypothetical protein